MNIPKFESHFEDTSLAPFWVIAPFLIYLVLLAIALTFMLSFNLLPSHGSLLGFGITVGGFALSVVMCVLLGGIRHRQYYECYHHAEESFRRELTTLDAPLLSQLAESKEVSRESQKIIIRHLNQTYPGWSLAQ